MEKNINNKGITLIALIITIIVMLILASVSIAMLMDNNGMIKVANDSKIKTELREIQALINKYKLRNENGRLKDGDYSGTITNNDLKVDKVVEPLKFNDYDNASEYYAAIYPEKINFKTSIGHGVDDENFPTEYGNPYDMDDVFFMNMNDSNIYYVRNRRIWQLEGEIRSGENGGRDYFDPSLEEYEITYYANGGTINGEDKIIDIKTQGKDLTLRDGEGFLLEDYELIGWSEDKDSKEIKWRLGDVYTEDKAIELYAVWELDGDIQNAAVKYVVNHYVHDLGATTYSLNSTENKEVTADSSLTLKLTNLKKEIDGYTYEEGFVNSGNEIKPTSGAVIRTTISADGTTIINLYYRPNYLYVQYNMNGGTLADTHGANYGTSGSLVTIDSNTNVIMGFYGSNVGGANLTNYTVVNGLSNYNNASFMNIVRTGYSAKTGLQWNTKADGTGTGYDQENLTYDAIQMANQCDKDLSQGDQTIVLYVNWEVNKYTLTCDENVNFMNLNKASTVVNGITVGVNASESTFTLNGTGNNTETRIYLGNIAHTFVANELYKISIEYVSGSYQGTGDCNFNFEISNASNSRVTVKNCETVLLSENSHSSQQTKEGILKINASGGSEGRYFFLAVDMPSGVNTYTFTKYTARIRITKVKQNQITYGQTYGSALYTPTMPGYKFEGWWTGRDGSGTQITSTTNVTTTSNQTIYAKWTPNIYKVTLNNQSATTAGTTECYYQYNTTKMINNVRAYYYKTAALTTPLDNGYKIVKPTKTGYEFNGYYTEVNGGGTQYIDESGNFVNNLYMKEATNKTLYAKWTDVEAPKIKIGHQIEYPVRRTSENSSSTLKNSIASSPVESRIDNVKIYQTPFWPSSMGGTATINVKPNEDLKELQIVFTDQNVDEFKKIDNTRQGIKTIKYTDANNDLTANHTHTITITPATRSNSVEKESWYLYVNAIDKNENTSFSKVQYSIYSKYAAYVHRAYKNSSNNINYVPDVEGFTMWFTGLKNHMNGIWDMTDKDVAGALECIAEHTNGSNNLTSNKYKAMAYFLRGVLLSPEMNSKSNEELIKAAYRVIYYREPDEKGFPFWMNELNTQERHQVIVRMLNNKDKDTNIVAEGMYDNSPYGL